MKWQYFTLTDELQTNVKWKVTVTVSVIGGPYDCEIGAIIICFLCNQNNHIKALVATSADSVPSSYLVRITIAPIGTTLGNLQWRRY